MKQDRTQLVIKRAITNEIARLKGIKNIEPTKGGRAQLQVDIDYLRKAKRNMHHSEVLMMLVVDNVSK